MTGPSSEHTDKNCTEPGASSGADRRIELYREEARRLLDLAKTVEPQSFRQELVRLAAQFQALADYVEKSERGKAGEEG
ncbi:MAG: hypothetical protein QOK29_801 [Rhodospirillaceae bacterium]|jgi:hypothetical protein|nr:hypothetical protein [Rhodospirillaceae bacterium]